MAVVDSSVIIHLARIGKLKLLRDYFEKIKITEGIEKEIINWKSSQDIKNSIGKWIEVKKITINEKSDSLSTADMELIKLAEKENDLILTNDEEIISYARIKNIKTMWLTTFLILCLRKKLVGKEEAKQVLYDLVKHGCYLRTDTYAAVQNLIEDE